MESRAKWADWANVVAGVWLFFSPLFGWGVMTPAAAWNAYACGMTIAVVAAIAAARPGRWQEWINLVVGMWVFIAPVVLGFWAFAAPLWNHILVGGLVAGLSLWALFRRQQMQGVSL